MHVIVGLGNPGAKYANNRHNVGFMAADAIVRRHASFQPWQKKFSAEVTQGQIGDTKVLVIKPQTFMNKSGQSVGEALRWHKLTPADLTVFYDELDLAPGRLRVKTGGGSGGHNGIRSIDAHCGQAYRRVRIGIGHPGDKARVHGHVLGDFAKADAEWLDPLLEAIADHAGLVIAGDEAGFMNRIALATKARPGAPDKPEPKGQSHIRQARPGNGPAKPEPTGPMAAMLKRLLGK